MQWKQMDWPVMVDPFNLLNLPVIPVSVAIDEYGAIQAVREKDTGTRQYDWFLSPDETECVVRERYASSEAVLEHMVNVAAQLQQLPEVADLSLEFYGDPSPALMKAVEAFEPAVFRFLGGL